MGRNMTDSCPVLMPFLLIMGLLAAGAAAQEFSPRCPRVPPGTFGICVNLCFTDADCGPRGLCCSNGCGRVCAGAVTSTPTEPPVIADGGFGGGRCPLRCPFGEKCVNYEQQCKRRAGGRCRAGQTCVPNNFAGCAAVRCTAATRCRLRQVQCIRAPCFPVAVCE